MLKTGKEEEIPSPKFDEEGNPIVVQEGSKSGAFTAPTLQTLRGTTETVIGIHPPPGSDTKRNQTPKMKESTRLSTSQTK
jgi:hypothetical protein